MLGHFAAWRARYVNDYGELIELTGWTTWLLADIAARWHGPAAFLEKTGRRN